MEEFIAMFARVLSKAQKSRSQKSEWIGTELAWTLYERAVMLKAVNVVRSQRGFPLAIEEDVRRADCCAAGHTDYSQKFALYCAELALGE